MCALIATLAISGCTQTPAQAARLADLDWIGGCWESADSSHHERWAPVRGARRDGHGVVYRGGQVVSSEQLALEQTAAGVTLWAAPAGQAATPFALTSRTSHGAVFENPAHDDPKRIRYRRDGDRLRAWTGARGGEKLALDARLSGCD